jgi:hypothetical protein
MHVRLGLGAWLEAVALAAAGQHHSSADLVPTADVGDQVVAHDQRGVRSAAERGQRRGDGLPSTRAVLPVAYSSSRTHPPVSRCSPSSRRAIRLAWVASSSAPARTARNAVSRSS